MFVSCRPGKLLGVGGRVQRRRGQRGLAAAPRKFRGGIGRPVTQEVGSTLQSIWLEGMEAAILILDFGEAETILKAERHLTGTPQLAQVFIFLYVDGARDENIAQGLHLLNCSPLAAYLSNIDFADSLLRTGG